MQVQIPTNGNRKVLENLSNMSSKSIPPILPPCDSETITPNNVAADTTRIAAHLRLMLNFSEITATLTSISAIAEVIAAKRTNRKNTTPTMLPRTGGKVWKTAGNVTNTSPAPCAGD